MDLTFIRDLPEHYLWYVTKYIEKNTDKSTFPTSKRKCHLLPGSSRYSSKPLSRTKHRYSSDSLVDSEEKIDSDSSESLVDSEVESAYSSTDSNVDSEEETESSEESVFDFEEEYNPFGRSEVELEELGHNNQSLVDLMDELESKSKRLDNSAGSVSGFIRDSGYNLLKRISGSIGNPFKRKKISDNESLSP